MFAAPLDAAFPEEPSERKLTRARVGHRKSGFGEWRCRSRRRSAWRRSSAPRGRSARGSLPTPSFRPCGRSGASNASSRQRRAHLGAAALAEDAADQRRLGDHVGRLPFSVGSFPSAAYSAGSFVGSISASLDVGVDAGDEFVDVVDDLFALRAVQLGRVGDLRFEVGFGVGGDHPLRAVHRAVAGRAAREGGEFGAARVPQHVHQEQAVLRRPRSRRRTSRRRGCCRRRAARRSLCRARSSRPSAGCPSIRRRLPSRRRSRP